MQLGVGWVRATESEGGRQIKREKEVAGVQDFYLPIKGERDHCDVYVTVRGSEKEGDRERKDKERGGGREGARKKGSERKTLENLLRGCLKIYIVVNHHVLSLFVHLK